MSTRFEPSQIRTIRMLIALAVLSVVFISVAIYVDSTVPSFSLKKAEWTCSASHTESRLIAAGKVIVPTTTTICDQWSRIPEDQ